MANYKSALALGLTFIMAAACGPDAGSDGGGKSGGAPVDEVLLSYTCDSGKTLTTRRGDGPTLVLDYDGREETLASLPVPRGARFTNANVRWDVSEAAGRETGVLMLGDQKSDTCTRTANAAAPDPGLAPCREEQLIWQAGDVEAALGHRQQAFTVQIRGEAQCLLPAWPVLDVQTKDGATVPDVTQAVDSYFGDAEPRGRVVLGAGRGLGFFVGWSIIPTGDAEPQSCPQVKGLALRVPAGGTLPVIGVDMQVCGQGLMISPFTDPKK